MKVEYVSIISIGIFFKTLIIIFNRNFTIILRTNIERGRLLRYVRESLKTENISGDRLFNNLAIALYLCLKSKSQ